MKILQLSDTHYCQNINDPELEQVLIKQVPLHQKLDQICLQEDLASFDLVMVTGDIVHEGTAEDYQGVDKLLKEKFAPLPIYYAHGNHDRKPIFYQGGIAQEWVQSDKVKDNSYTHFDYTFDYQGIQIIVLDSAKDYSHAGILEPDQITWLEEVTASNLLPKMVFLHHPIIGDPYFVNFTMEDQEPFLNWVEKHSVIGVFTGHTHSPAINIKGNLKQYTTYAVSFGLDKIKDGSQLFTNVTGYSVIEYDPTRGLTVAPRIIQPTYEVYKSTSLEEMDQLNKSYEH